MSYLGFLFALGIPLGSLLVRMVVSLTGGYKNPLAWTFSYYSALVVVFVSVFILTSIGAEWRNKTKLELLSQFLAICVGSAVGLAFAQAGVFGDSPYEDPSRGNVPFKDVVGCALIGTFSGLGLGLGTGKWVQVMVDKGVSLTTALTFCASIATLSIGIAFSLSLF